MDSFEKGDEVMMPGFRFHPTDEELVSFYLKRKIQQRPICIELIKQLDIYRYDPWDLPKLAISGEKEWYFYCPRGRKYRNSARPNRVTGAGFWKATGTDRPIYSSEGTICIGLKKSLVFYKGRAAKGTKTDWMMHEFRLPSVNNSSSMPKRPLHNTIPLNEAWAICRIFKRTANNNSMAHRAISQTWASQFPETTTTESDMFGVCQTIDANQYALDTISSTTTNAIEFDSSTSFAFSEGEIPLDSMHLNFCQPQHSNELVVDLSLKLNDATEGSNDTNSDIADQMQAFDFPFNFPWESPVFPTETSTGFSTNISYE